MNFWTKNIFFQKYTLIWVIYWLPKPKQPIRLKTGRFGMPVGLRPWAAQSGWMGRLEFGHQNITQIKVLMKKIRFLAKIVRWVAVFPFLGFLTSLPLQFCFNYAYVWIFGNFYLHLTKFRMFFHSNGIGLIKIFLF